MGRPEIFNSPIRKLYRDSKNHKVYQFPGREGYFRAISNIPANGHVRFDCYELYFCVNVIDKKSLSVVSKKRIRRCKSYSQAEELRTQLETESKNLGESKSKINTIEGLLIFVDIIHNSGNKCWKKLFNTWSYRLVTSIIKILIAVEKGKRLNEIETHLAHGFCQELRTYSIGKLLSMSPEAECFLSGEEVKSKHIDLIIHVLNRAFRVARKRKVLNVNLYANYFPASEKIDLADNTNTLSLNDKRLFRRILFLLVYFGSQLPFSVVNITMWSKILISVIKLANPQRSRLFTNATILDYYYNAELAFDDPDDESESQPHNRSLILVPEGVGSTYKGYSPIIVPSPIDELLYLLYCSKLAIYEARELEWIPLLFSKNISGVPEREYPINISEQMIEHFFLQIQVLLGFEGRMTPHSAKDNFAMEQLIKNLMKPTMEITGNQDFNTFSKYYLKIPLGESGIEIRGSHLAGALYTSSNFSKRYQKVISMGFDGFSGREMRVFKALLFDLGFTRQELSDLKAPGEVFIMIPKNNLIAAVV